MKTGTKELWERLQLQTCTINYQTKKSELDRSILSPTAGGSLELHLLHVNLTGRHPDGNWVNDGRVLEGTHITDETHSN